jgi:glyoxylase-like metal-dependent hydrolase (beta-lactamase superfamily II)
VTRPVEPIDLLHLGVPRSIGAYLVETSDGLALVDCGPSTCLPALIAALGERDLTFADVRHLLLTHIHLDHAGAAGAIVRDHPHVRVHVSEVGAPHLVEPSRLEASARRLYGASFDRLWGALVPVPAANVEPVGEVVIGLEALPTPGHAWHHVSYLHPDGTLYSGDVAGCRFAPGSFVLPPLPPPEIDLEAWDRSIDELERRAPEWLALIHFGAFDDVRDHLTRLRATIHRWAGWSAAGLDEAAFAAAAHDDIAGAGDADADHYLDVVPAWHAYRGLERYWRKRRESAP